MAEDDRSGSSGALLIAFTLGAIAGAAVALLLAPATGRETREFLGEKAREGVRKAKDVYAEAAATALGDES
jgi:gas vesicle protein